LRSQLVLTHVQYNETDRFEYITDEFIKNRFQGGPEDTFTYYKLDNRIKFSTFYDDMVQQIDLCSNQTDDSNVNLSFRAYRLNTDDPQFMDNEIYDYLYSESICLMIRNEYFLNWEFMTLEVGLQPEPEYCENCNEREVLTIACGCNQSFYCSIRCRIKNMNYHKNSCHHAKEVRSLLAFSPSVEPKEEINYNLGLGNMGNSCYLSSVFQVLRLFEPFAEWVKKMDRELLRKLNETKLNIVPYVHDAFLRMNYSEQDEYEPYLLKGVIGVKNNNVPILAKS
jgi:hypothetical protein